MFEMASVYHDTETITGWLFILEGAIFNYYDELARQLLASIKSAASQQR